MLDLGRTDVLKAGVGPNVIRRWRATVDIRHCQTRHHRLLRIVRRIIGDPAIAIEPLPIARPASPASRLDTEMYRVLEQVGRRMYEGSTVMPSMSTGASDQAQLRAKGIQSYGIGAAATIEDRTNFGAHSDVERLLESSLYKFVEFTWSAVTEVAVRK